MRLGAPIVDSQLGETAGIDCVVRVKIRLKALGGVCNSIQVTGTLSNEE